jgi:hypothetical protein
LPHNIFMCLYDSRNKQPLSPLTSLNSIFNNGYGLYCLWGRNLICIYSCNLDECQLIVFSFSWRLCVTQILWMLRITCCSNESWVTGVWQNALLFSYYNLLESWCLYSGSWLLLFPACLLLLLPTSVSKSPSSPRHWIAVTPPPSTSICPRLLRLSLSLSYPVYLCFHSVPCSLPVSLSTTVIWG